MLELAMSISNQKEIIGNRIKKLRKESKIKQETLAQAAGIAAGFLSEVENGKKGVSMEVLGKLADYFDVSTDYLLGRTDVRNPIITIAAHADEDLPPEAQERIREYAEMMRQKYMGDKKGK